MAGKMLSPEPAVAPTASVRDCKLGAYTEVGARTILLEVAMADYSYVVNDAQITYTTIGKFCSIAAMTRINPGNHPDAPRLAGAFHLPRQQPIFRAKATMPISLHGGASITSHIGHDVWIGHGAIILPGRSIGTGAVIAAGAIVTKDVACLYDRGRQPGPADQAALSRIASPDGLRSSRGGTGTMRRFAAPCPISASSMSRAFSTNMTNWPEHPAVSHSTGSASIVTELFIEGGRALLGHEISETTSADRRPRDRRRGHATTARARPASMPAACWCCRASSICMAMPSSGR